MCIMVKFSSSLLPRFAYFVSEHHQLAVAFVRPGSDYADSLLEEIISGKHGA